MVTLLMQLIHHVIGVVGLLHYFVLVLVCCVVGRDIVSLHC